MNTHRLVQRNALYFILGAFALAVILLVNNVGDIKGFFSRTFQTASGIGVRYDQFVSPDSTRKVTVVFSSDGVTNAKKLNGFTVDIDGMPTSATNVELEISSAVGDLDWIHADNTDRDPMRVTAVGTDAMTSDEDLFTLSFTVPSSFNSAVLEVVGELEVTTGGNSVTQSFPEGTITVKKAIDAELDYEEPEIDDDTGTVMVFIKNVDDIEFNGIDFEIDNVPDELDNFEVSNDNTDIESWTGAFNDSAEPMLGSFVGTNSVGGDDDDVQLLEISFDVDGSLSSNDYLLLTAKLILDDNSEEILFPLRIYLGEGGGNYSEVGLVASDIDINNGHVDVILTATNLDSDTQINGFDFSVENFPTAFRNLNVYDEYVGGSDMVPASKNWTKAININNLNSNNFVLTSVGTASIGSGSVHEADMYRLSFDLNGSTNLQTAIRIEGEFIVDNEESQDFAPVIIDLSAGSAVGNADQNGNGYRNAQDLSCIVIKWRNQDNTRTLRADINSDGTVEVRDLAILLATWQAGTPLGPDTCIERK